MWKTFSQSDWSSLIKYAWNLSNIELEWGTCVSQASFIKIPPFLLKISCGKRNGQTDGQGDYYRAPASQCRALIKDQDKTNE
jgi:hypothetical protein